MESAVTKPQIGKLQGRGRRVLARWPRAFLHIPALLVGLVMLVPIIYLALRAFGTEQSIVEILFTQRMLDVLLRSGLLVVTTTFCAMLIAVPIAWLTVRTDLPMRRIWSVLTILPLVIPSYIYAQLLISGLGPKGMLQDILHGPFGIESLPSIYGFPGALIALTLITFPYVLLTVRGALWRIDPSLEEAAQGLGQTRLQTFMRVTLPLLWPSIAAGGLLVALYTLSDFGAVSLLRYETFTTAIYTQYQLAFDSRHIAAAFSLVLILIAGVILLFEARARRRSKYYRTHSGSQAPPPTVKLDKWRWPALVFCGAVVTLTLVVPVSMLVYWLVRGMLMGEPLLLLWKETFNSLYVSGLAALVTVFAAIPIAVLIVRHRHWLTGLLERVSYLGFAMPGIAVALALVFFGINFARPIYLTIIMLILAYLILFLPTAIGTIRTSLMQINPAMEEAARGMGRSPFYVFFRIHLPLIKTGVLAGAALVFLLVMKELPATMILSPIGFKTLATSIWSASSEAFFARTAAPALFLIIVSSLSIAFLLKRERWM